MNNAPADLLEVTNPRADSPPKEDVPTNAAAPTALPSAAATTKKISRRKLFRRLITAATLPLASGAYGTEVEPFWIDWHDVPMPIRDLPKSFDGFRITQLTDLHAGPYVPMSYLSGVVDRVIKSKPDLVIVTGDLVNHTLDWVVPVSDLLARIPAEAGIPVIATLGNHDYDVSSAYAGVPTRIADALQAALAARKITLLRNRATPIAHPDGRLWFVGLEDLWSGRFSPQVAFAGLNAKEPIIALSHNPDTASELDTYGPQWIISGHTHGGQVRIPGFGALLLNVQNRQYQQGLFRLAHSQLYVSRIVGYFRQLHAFCRPEIPTFVLKSAG